MLKGAMSIIICFHRYVFNFYDVIIIYFVLCDYRHPKVGWRIRSAVCNDCQAGKHTGFCHHIVVGLEGLVSILSGLILAGEVNSGKMHWGLKQSNDDRHHVPTALLCILSGSECMTTYSGSHVHRFDPVMESFNMSVFDCFGPNHPPLMTQELYGPESHTSTSHQSQIQSLRKRYRTEDRKEGTVRRTLHRELVCDLHSSHDGIDLRRPVNEIVPLVQKSSPNSLNKIERKELNGRSRQSLLKVIHSRRNLLSNM